MTTQEKLARNKLSLLELAEYLKNVSQACKINGVSRQHFYDIKKTYEEHGLEGLIKENVVRAERLCKHLSSGGRNFLTKRIWKNG